MDLSAASLFWFIFRKDGGYGSGGWYSGGMVDLAETRRRRGKSRLPVFRQEATDNLVRLRTALFDLMRSKVGVVKKSTDVQGAFGVDLKLSWQVFRMVTATGALEVMPHVPNAVGMKKLMKAAREKGLAEGLVREVEGAYEDFERHVQSHGGDRGTYDTMVAGLGTGGVGGEVETRRALFEAHRRLWGVQQDVMVGFGMLHPSGTVGRVDVVDMRTRMGLRRLRADAQAVVDTWKFIRTGEPSTPVFEALDEKEAAAHGAPILPQFSTDPLPELVMDRQAGGEVVTSLAGDSIGQLSAADLTFGTVIRSVLLGENEKGQRVAGSMHLSAVPTELTVVDYLVHRPSFRGVEAEVGMYGHATSFPREWQNPPLPKLPCGERVMYLGGGAGAAILPEVPNYVDMLRFASERAGWRLEEFDVYRVRVEYPPMDTVLRLKMTFGELGFAAARG